MNNIITNESKRKFMEAVEDAILNDKDMVNELNKYLDGDVEVGIWGASRKTQLSYLCEEEISIYISANLQRCLITGGDWATLIGEEFSLYKYIELNQKLIDDNVEIKDWDLEAEWTPSRIFNENGEVEIDEDYDEEDLWPDDETDRIDWHYIGSLGYGYAKAGDEIV